MTLEIESVSPGQAAPLPGVALDARPPKVFRLPGVYRPQEDSMLLAREYLRSGLAGRGAVLDACCGTGYLALIAAWSGCPSVTAVDSSLRAVLSARANAAVLGGRIDVHHGDLAGLAGRRVFDTILANPPYVPWFEEGTARPCTKWDAGRDGRTVIDVLCLAAQRLLRPGGTLMMVHSAISGVEETLDVLGREGLDASVSARQRIPFGPVMRRRREALVRAGYLDPCQSLEEIVVIRASKPGKRMKCLRYTADGPLLVPGPVRIELPDGTVAESDRVTVALCLCRRSRIFPFCDTSHRRKRKRRADRLQDGTEKA